MNQHLSLHITDDGSKTIYNELVKECYHSKHGALQEAKHVFLTGGAIHWLNLSQKEELAILEVGFGTGLNFLLTADYCTQNRIQLHYTGIEAHPISKDLIREMNYQNYFQTVNLYDNFLNVYSDEQDQSIKLNKSILLNLIYKKILDVEFYENFDIVYFDAFAPIHQPEMWTPEVISHVCSFLKPNGLFVTYSVTGELKRILRSLGFLIERPQGAKGKREMMRATKS